MSTEENDATVEEVETEEVSGLGAPTWTAEDEDNVEDDGPTWYTEELEEEEDEEINLFEGSSEDFPVEVNAEADEEINLFEEASDDESLIEIESSEDSEESILGEPVYEEIEPAGVSDEEFELGEPVYEEIEDYQEDPEDMEEIGLSRTLEAEQESLSEEITSGAITADLRIDKSAYSIEPGTVFIDELILPDPVKKHRKKTYSGLTKSVAEMGVIEPIHVLKLEGYEEWLSEEHESWEVYSGSKYQLLSGMRRVFAAVKNGLSDLPAQIWSFKDPAYGREVAILLSMLLDKKVRHSWDEIWNTFKVLEQLYENLSPSKIEYLLDIEPGDAMKLKDIMESQEEFPEVAGDLIDGKKSLQQSYNALQKLRKELEQWEREDSKGLGEVEEASDVVGSEGDGETRSADEVKRILDLGDEDLDLDEDSFGAALGDFEAEQQRVDDRHPLDPVLRGKVLNRDGYSCQICMMGEGMNSSLILPSLTVHHRIPVYINEKNHPTVRCEDSMENLITLCATCHNTVHAVSDAGLKLGISKEDFDEMDAFQQERWKNILKNSRIISEAEKAVGYKRNKSKPRTLPPSKPFWVLDKENTEAIQLAEASDVDR